MTQTAPFLGPIPTLPPPEHIITQPPPPPGPPFPVLRRVYDTFQGEFEGRVASFIQVLDAFSRTTGIPAPVEDPLIEAVARNGGAFVIIEPQPAPEPAEAVPPPLPEPSGPRAISKLLLVDRLAVAGKLRSAMAALKIGEPVDSLSDAELVLRERWLAAQEIAVADEAVRAFLAGLGLLPDEVLA
jgi:hypothetical protein